MLKALLCIPPDYDYNFPPLGTPALCAFLKQKGIDARQADLNLRYGDFLSGHIQGHGILLPQKKLILKSLLKKFFFECLKGRYYSHLLKMENGGISVEIPYDNSTNSSFYFAERLLSSPHLLRYLEDEKENTFLQFYLKDCILSYIAKEKIGLLGISIISPSQVIASLTLGLLVKKSLPHAHVTIGGQWPTLYRRELMRRKDLFRCFDSIIVFEGETPIWRLAETLKAKGKIDIPNVITKDGRDDFSLTRTEEDLDALPAPDFDGLPLKEYAGMDEGRVLTSTFETSRGCYWGKCAYCVDLPLPKPTYRRKDPRLVVRDMKALKEKYGIKMLMFGDPGLSPRQMLEISDEIIKEKLDIKWWTMARLDPGFNGHIFSKASRAGLKQVNFGFESASDRVCDLVHKGNRKAVSSRVIQEASKAGIEAGMQTILGLPTETMEEALDTVQFLIEHKDSILGDVAFNIYYVTPSNYVFKNPQKYGLILKKDPKFAFQFFIPFEDPNGLTTEQAQLLQCLHMSLSGKTASLSCEADDSVKDEDILSVPEDIENGALDFTLCGDTMRFFYLLQKPDNYFFISEALRDIFILIQKGESLGAMRSYWSKRDVKDEEKNALEHFIGSALQDEFLVKKAKTLYGKGAK